MSLLQDLSEWMWDPDDEVQQFDRIAEMFYRDTGFIRPGKSVPLEMGYQDENERQLRFQMWRREKSRELLKQVRDALHDEKYPDEPYERD